MGQIGFILLTTLRLQPSFNFRQWMVVQRGVGRGECHETQLFKKSNVYQIYCREAVPVRKDEVALAAVGNGTASGASGTAAEECMAVLLAWGGLNG